MGKSLTRVVLCIGILVGGLAFGVAQPPDAHALESAAVKVQSTTGVSGTVNASELSLGASDTLKLDADTVLNLDADLSCAAIKSSGYDLTIKGSKTLTIYSTSTSSIGIDLGLGGQLSRLGLSDACHRGRDREHHGGHGNRVL